MRANIKTLSYDHGNKQVIAPFLIILRVADRRALTSNAVTSGNIGSIHFESQGETTTGEATISDVYPTSSMGPDGETPDGPGVGVEPETAIEEVHL